MGATYYLLSAHQEKHPRHGRLWLHPGVTLASSQEVVLGTGGDLGFPSGLPDPGALAAAATFRHHRHSAGAAKQAGSASGRPGGQWDRKYSLS